MSPAVRASILINLGQALLIVFLLGRPPEQSTSADSTVPPPSLADATPSPAKARSPASAGSALGPEAVAQLERAGLSREIVVQALLADFNHRWDQHVLDVEKRYVPRAVPDREYIELGRERDAALARHLKTALGEDGYLAWHKAEALRLINGAGLPLSAEAAEQAYRLQTEFDETHRDLQMAMEDGVTDMADAVALQMRARENLDARLEALFGKTQLDAMRGYADPAASVYRTFGDIAPSPEQVRAVLSSDENHAARERAVADRLKHEPAGVDSILAELQENDAKRDAELNQIFGAEAHAVARRQNDPAYKTIRQYAGAWDIADTQVEPVCSLVSSFKRRREQTLSAAAMSEAAGHAVAWRDIHASLAQERLKTEAALRNQIGDERLRRMGGNGLFDMP